MCSSISYDLYGCIQAIVSPAANEKGELQDSRWFDVARLEVLDEKPVMDIPGGRFEVERKSEMPEPTRRHGPTEKPTRQ